jgi:hypothetical protein
LNGYGDNIYIYIYIYIYIIIYIKRAYIIYTHVLFRLVILSGSQNNFPTLAPNGDFLHCFTLHLGVKIRTVFYENVSTLYCV